jgi:hypothetical protein
MRLPETMTLADGRELVRPCYPLIMHDDGWLWTIVKYRQTSIATLYRLQRWLPLTGENLTVAILSGLEMAEV